MKDYKGVIFDLDGTLIDSMHIWEKIDKDFLGKRNIDVPTDYMESIAHLCAYDTAVYTIERFNLSDTPQMLIQEWLDMALDEYAHVDLKPGVEEYMNYLSDNKIKIGIATATEPQIAEAALKDRSFAGYIDSLVTVSQVKRGKGYPDIYLRCAEMLGLTPGECIVCDDILAGIKGAKDGGFYTVAMYDECSKGQITQIKNECDVFIQDFRELIM